MKQSKAGLSSTFGAMENAVDQYKDLFKLSSMSLTLLVVTILVSILASDLSPHKLFENLCQIVSVENVIKLWSTFHQQSTQLKNKCYNYLAWFWSEYILPVFHHWKIKALEVKLQLLQAKIRAAEKRYEQDQKRCDNRSDEMKGITQLLQILQDTVYELSNQQDKDCTTCDNRYKSLHKLQEEKLLALQITLTSLCTAGEKVKEEQKRIAEEHEALKEEQQRLANAQKEMMDQSLPKSDSIERVQSDVASLRSYLLEEADSRRSLLDGRRGSLSQSQSSL